MKDQSSSWYPFFIGDIRQHIIPTPADEARGIPNVDKSPWVGSTPRYYSVFKSRMDLQDFPYDEQVLRVSFETQYSTRDLKIVRCRNDSLAYESGAIALAEWEVKDVQSRVETVWFDAYQAQYDRFDLLITIRRIPDYYIYEILLPAILLIHINALGFFFAVDSGRFVLSSSVFLGKADDLWLTHRSLFLACCS